MPRSTRAKVPSAEAHQPTSSEDGGKPYLDSATQELWPDFEFRDEDSNTKFAENVDDLYKDEMTEAGEDLGSCFNRIAQIIEADPTQVGLARSLAQRLLADTQPPPMAKATPDQRYENRADRKEMAPDFIRRVYGHLLDGNFTRADLRRIDDSLEVALRAWEYRHRRLSLEELNLPTVEERNTRLLEAGIDTEPDPMRRKALKHIAANRAHKRSKVS